MNEPFSAGPVFQPSIGLREALAGAQRVVLTAHVDPDPDALGSAMGLYNILLREGWDVVPVCTGRLPSFAPSLPGHESIVRFPDRLEPGVPVERILRPGDALIVCDTPVADRMEGFYEAHRDMLSEVQIIVFDHHFTSSRFGTVNYVDPAAAATAEVVVDVLDAGGIPLDANSSACLMIALIADTQCFRTENTRPQSLLLGARLSAAGAPIYDTAELLFKTRPLSAVKLWGAALERLKAEDGGVLWTSVTAEMLGPGATMEDTEGLVDFMLSSRDARVAIVLKELHAGETKVSMRTVPGVDATKIVRPFGGGGHQRAAGATIMARADEAAEQLLPLVRAEVRSSAAPEDALVGGTR